MANICEFDILVRGTEKAARLFYESVPCMDFKEINDESGTSNRYEIRFSGDCKWSVNWNVTDDWNSEDDVDFDDLDNLDEDDLEELGENYWEYSFKVKSEKFGCEVLAHYWSEESEFDQFDYYDKGSTVKQRKIKYSRKNKFDWNKTEFVGHVGEYNDSVNGEERDNEFMSTLQLAFGQLGQSEEEQKKNAALRQISQLADAMAELEQGDVNKDIDFNNLLNFSFAQGKQYKNDLYSFDIPDSFEFKKDVDGREFVAWIPNESDPDDYTQSKVIIYPSDAQNGASFEEVLKDVYDIDSVKKYGVIPLTQSAVIAHMLLLAYQTYSFQASLTNMECKIFLMPADSNIGGAGYLLKGKTYSFYYALLAINQQVKMIRIDVNFNLKDSENIFISSINGLLARIKPLKNSKSYALNQNDEKYVSNVMNEKLLNDWLESNKNNYAQLKVSRNLFIQGVQAKCNFLVGQGKNTKTISKELKKDLTDFLEKEEYVRDKIAEETCDALIKQEKLGCPDDILSKIYTEAKECVEACNGTEINIEDGPTIKAESSKYKELSELLKPFDEKSIELKKAQKEAEKKAKEEAEAKEKAAEEAARMAKLAAEREEKEKLAKAQAEWKTKKEKNEKFKKDELARQEKIISKKTRTDIKNADNDCKNRLKKLDKTIADETSIMQAETAEIITLNIFKLKRKKELKKDVALREKNIEKLKKEKLCVEDEYNKKIEEINSSSADARKKLVYDLEKKYDSGISPVEAAERNKKVEYYTPREWNFSDLTTTQKAIIQAIETANKPLAFGEIKKYNSSLTDYDTFDLGDIAARLVQKGFLAIVRTDEGEKYIKAENKKEAQRVRTDADNSVNKRKIDTSYIIAEENTSGLNKPTIEDYKKLSKLKKEVLQAIKSANKPVAFNEIRNYSKALTDYDSFDLGDTATWLVQKGFLFLVKTPEGEKYMTVE